MNKEAIYMNSDFFQSRRQREERHAEGESRGCPWHFIAGSLGILCFFFLLVTLLLGYMHFQKPCKCENVTDPERNSTSSPGVCAHSHSPVPTGVPQDKQTPRHTCREKWSCCGGDCYFFSKEETSWDESRRSCAARGALLVKVDDEEEQRFIQQRIEYNFWVGLHRRGATLPWLWLDGAELSRKLTFQPSSPDAKCGYVKLRGITAAACARAFPYICEKKFTCLNN